MALQPDELFGDPTSQRPLLRAYPHADGIAVATLEQLAGDAELAMLTPLVSNGDGTLGVWEDADASSVVGFLWAPDVPHQGLAAGETLIQVLKRGVVDARDVVLPAGQTQSVLDDALRAQSLRDAGVTVKGIDGVA